MEAISLSARHWGSLEAKIRRKKASLLVNSPVKIGMCRLFNLDLKLNIEQQGCCESDQQKINFSWN